jgi:hypothetical protein
MRTIPLRASLSLALPLLAAGGCKWTDFDDLKEDTWVTATGKPDNDAANWAVAITRLVRTGSGGTLAVLGASEAIYNDVVIGPNGDTKTQSESELNTQFAVGNLAVEPLFLSNPEEDEATLITGLEANRIAVVRAFGGQTIAFGVTGLAQPSGATYMTSPPRTIDDDPATQVLVAGNDTVFGAFFDQTKAPNPQTKCSLVDEAMAPASVRALGAYRLNEADPSDDVLALTDSGKLIAYPGTVFNGCGTGGMGGTQVPTPGVVRDLMFAGVQTGSQILTFRDGGAVYALVQAHNDSGKGRLGLYRITATAIEEVGAPRETDRLKTASLFQPGDGKRYVLAGMPGALVDGVEAGQVQVIEISTATGIASTPAMTLNDAQPEDGQAFGRGVAELPFNNRKIIAVAADNDVYLYFRTSLYEETREGR